jgi:DNA-binding response OmpR family regulator
MGEAAPEARVLVGLDVLLPDLTGVEVCARLRGKGARHLRKKVDRYHPPLIHTVRRVGYTLRARG